MAGWLGTNPGSLRVRALYLTRPRTPRALPRSNALPHRMRHAAGYGLIGTGSSVAEAI